MAARKRGQGQVDSWEQIGQAPPKRVTFEPALGPKPPDLDFAGEGLRVALRAARGLTKKNLIRVPFRFQVPPLESFGADDTYAWTDFDTLRKGQFSRPGSRQLKTVAFQTMFIDHSYLVDLAGHYHRPNYVVWPGNELLRLEPYQIETLLNPRKRSQALRAILDSGTPFWLRVRSPALGEEYDVNMLASLRSLRVEERAGEPDARYVDVQFTEYRKLTIPRKRLGKQGATKKRGGQGRGKHDDLPTNVKVSADGSAEDLETHRQVATAAKPATLRRLAQHYYGDPTLWRRIARANQGLKNIAGDTSLGKVPRDPWPTGRLRKLTIPKLASRETSGTGGMEAR